MNEDILDLLADRYQQAFSRVQIAAEQAAQDAWFFLNSFSGDDEEEWFILLWPILLGAAQAAAGITTQYLQWQLDLEEIPVTLEVPDLDWLEDDFDVWKDSPMVAARAAVSEMSPNEAVTAAATRVSTVISAAMRETEQRSLNQMIEQLGEIEFDIEVEVEEVEEPQRREAPSVKFRRVPQQGACGFCRVAADRLYSQKARDDHPLGAWHTYCRCTWRKVTESEASRWEQRYAGGRWRDVIDERAEVPA